MKQDRIVDRVVREVKEGLEVRGEARKRTKSFQRRGAEERRGGTAKTGGNKKKRRAGARRYVGPELLRRGIL